MKTKHIIFGILLAAAVSACQGAYSVKDTVVSTKGVSYTVDVNGGVVEIPFYCNMYWHAVVAPANAVSDVSDVLVFPICGVGSEKMTTLKVTVPKNYGNKRDILVNIIGEAGESAVRITQKGAADPTVVYGSIEMPYPPTMLAQQMLSGDVPADAVYVRGIVSKVKEISTQYGNATFWLTEDGTHPDSDNAAFQVYRAKDYEGANIADENLLKVGDVVTVYSPVTVYNGTTPETVANKGRIIAVNGLGNACGAGTEESPYNVGKAFAVCNETGETSTGDVYVTGVISKIKEVSPQYGNATYWITDDGWHPSTDTETVQVFRGKWIGGEAFTSEDQIKVGDVVVVKGSLVKYKNATPEINSGNQIISINGKTE